MAGSAVIGLALLAHITLWPAPNSAWVCNAPADAPYIHSLHAKTVGVLVKPLKVNP